MPALIFQYSPEETHGKFARPVRALEIAEIGGMCLGDSQLTSSGSDRRVVRQGAVFKPHDAPAQKAQMPLDVIRPAMRLQDHARSGLGLILRAALPMACIATQSNVRRSFDQLSFLSPVPTLGYRISYPQTFSIDICNRTTIITIAHR